jgi:hypothetical protein
MEPISTLLAAGAAAALSDVAGQAVKDAYNGLKSVLAGRLTSVGLLEQAPQAAAEEMQKKDLTEDTEILAKLDALSKALEQEPPDQLARLGVDIQQVQAAHDIIVQQITSLGGIQLRKVRSKKGKVQIEGLKTGGSGGN